MAATTPKKKRIGVMYCCYCTISLFLVDVVGVKAEGGQYSAYEEADLHKLYVMEHQPIAV
jgi:hypothetical protein